jgi:GAF domain-containing protein
MSELGAGMAELSDDQGLAALAQFFIDDGTLGDTLLRVAELTCKVIPVAAFAGITLLVDGRPATGACTDPQAAEIDAAQYKIDSGPCLDAFRRHQVFRIDSTYTDRRWPEFTAAAAAHGIVATLSVPLTARGEGLGALNLYSRTAPFDDQAVAQAEVFAVQASIVLANAQVYWDARQLGERLQQAMRSRATIEHAVGILMAEGGRTPEETFQLLVRVSQRENRKLRDIASEIVDRTVHKKRSG